MCFGMIWGCLKMCCIPSNPENMGNMHKHDDQHLDFGVVEQVSRRSSRFLLVGGLERIHTYTSIHTSNDDPNLQLWIGMAWNHRAVPFWAGLGMRGPPPVPAVGMERGWVALTWTWMTWSLRRVWRVTEVDEVEEVDEVGGWTWQDLFWIWKINVRKAIS